MRTLAFPYTEAMAEKIHGYTLGSEVNDTWQDLNRRYTRHPKNLPYRDLSLGLRYVSSDYATICKDPDGPGTLLLMRKKIDTAIISRLFAAFERDLAARHGAPFEDLLGPLLRRTKPRTIHIAKYLQADTATHADIPNWVFDVATWRTIELLRGALKLPDGTDLLLRPDIDGNLVAFNRPLPETHPRAEQGIHYISLEPITVPGYPGILLNLDAHISATTGFPGNAKSLWIATDDTGMLLTARHRYDRPTNRNVITGLLPQLVDSFSIRGVPANFTADDLLATHPRIRARHATTPDRHPIGSGPGRRFLDCLLEHATARLNTASLVLETTPIRNIDAAGDPDRHAKLASAVNAAARPIHISVVYQDDLQRHRSAQALTEVLNLPENSLTTAESTFLDGALTITFDSAKTDILVAPGPTHLRDTLAEQIISTRTPDALHLVLAESNKELAAAKPAAEDPKPQLRRALAAHGTVSQFIDPASTPKPDAVDHPANAAVRDLLRASGLTATTPTRVFSRPLQPQPCVIVGLYTREQNQPATRMISLSALISDGTDTPWHMLGYHPDAHGWNDLPTAIAAHHATDLSQFNDPNPATRTALARAYTERALHQLRTRYDDIPMIIYIDGSNRFPLWSGTTNKNLGNGQLDALPHLGMINPAGISLVRVNTASDGKLPQPVRATGNRANADDGAVPATERLHQLPGAHQDTYYLINRSRSDKAFQSSVRAGHRQTRFDLAEARELRTPWHAMTCTEFLLLEHGTFERQHLAALSARLCGHSLAWDGRTARPAPVHLARQILEDHPGRKTAAR
ncbi:RNaseH domain-containing protein [Micromonospora sp. C95]|uniref:RNaseH domain-containing protein n=1 Tax=Micromonospora sp. C95 TaxID=2824882 RepID=UPI001B35C0DD|nr:RNaseH domain-containing protein [Micromonospora sp. C95]